jgi:hypothetical protein
LSTIITGASKVEELEQINTFLLIALVNMFNDLEESPTDLMMESYYIQESLNHSYIPGWIPNQLTTIFSSSSPFFPSSKITPPRGAFTNQKLLHSPGAALSFLGSPGNKCSYAEPHIPIMNTNLKG